LERLPYLDVYAVSVDIKPKGIVRGWSNIIHLTATKKNCCGVGDRMPGIWFISKTTRLHIAAGVNKRGNTYYNTDALPLKVFTRHE